MNDVDKRLSALIAGLTDLAKDPRAEPDPWSKGWEEPEPDRFERSLTRSTIKIWARDGDGSYPFEFSILDENGRTIESLTALGESDDDYGLALLFAALVRSKRGIDEKLTEIMKELNINERRYLDPDEPPF